jgi:hypothetical protein
VFYAAKKVSDKDENINKKWFKLELFWAELLEKTNARKSKTLYAINQQMM